ncbi:MAG: DUF4838 domain-containing protein [Lentisphaeria bacterium]|nr:DUF4838 domain-containing protein [Lentisphaeria bacterium]
MKNKILLAAFFVASLLPAAEFTLASGGKSNYKIVIAEKPARQVKLAADELAAFLKQMTGAEFPVVSDATAKGKYEIILGETRRNIAVPEKFKVTNHEGFALLTDGNSFQIRGKIARGTLYGVYDFLDEKCGVRFLAWDYTHVPKKSTLKVDLDPYKYEPPFDYRNIISCGDANAAPEYKEGAWAVRNRLNSVWAYIPVGPNGVKVGGLKHLGGFVHNLHFLMPHKKYFKDHPEYFAMRAGKRRAMQYPTGRFASLPCLSNPEVKEVIVAEVRRILKNYFNGKQADPDDQILFPIDYHDHNQVCQCEPCNKINEEEETQGGTMFRFLNALSDDISKDYPNLIFSSLAYGPTLKPGKTKLRKNIIIRYAPIRMDNGRALDDPKSAVNITQLTHLKNWLAAGTQFHVWYYAGNFNGGIIPHPDLKGIEMNFPLLTRYGMKGMFCETVQAAGIEMKELRSYIIAKYLWRPEKNIRDLVIEFCHLYYGKGAPKVLEYLKLIHDYHYNVVDAKRDTPLTLRGAPAYSHAYNMDMIDKMDKILDEAERLAEDPVKKLHVAVMHMPAWHLRLVAAMNTERRVTVLPDKWRFKTDPENKLTPNTDASKWGKISITDFWTNQEPYKNYHGTAWYSVDFEVDDKVKDEMLSLYFTSVDGEVEVYIDGKLAGKVTDNSWNTGFYVHLPWKLAAGKHEMKVKVTKDRSAAGIWKPVGLLNMAQKLSAPTLNAAKRYMATELGFVKGKRRAKNEKRRRQEVFKRINTLLDGRQVPVTSLTPGVVTKMAHTLVNVHKTFASVKDADALNGFCARQLANKRWTLGQSINYHIYDMLKKDPKGEYKVRIRLKVKKSGGKGEAAIISFCYYNKGSWSGGNCAPVMKIALKDLPDNKYVWIEYPHKLKYKADVRSQMVAVRAANNPKNMEYLHVDCFEVRPANAKAPAAENNSGADANSEMVVFYAKDIKSGHKTYKTVADDGAEKKQCAEQSATKKWTLGQGINCIVSDLFDDIEKVKTYRARVRIKVKKKGNAGLGAVISFCYYEKGSWRGGNCAPDLKVALKDLPDNEWVWVEYPHILKYKENIRYQLINIKAPFNPKNVEYLRVDRIEVRRAN